MCERHHAAVSLSFSERALGRLGPLCVKLSDVAETAPAAGAAAPAASDAALLPEERVVNHVERTSALELLGSVWRLVAVARRGADDEPDGWCAAGVQSCVATLDESLLGENSVWNVREAVLGCFEPLLELCCTAANGIGAAFSVRTMVQAALRCVEESKLPRVLKAGLEALTAAVRAVRMAPDGEVADVLRSELRGEMFRVAESIASASTSKESTVPLAASKLRAALLALQPARNGGDMKM